MTMTDPRWQPVAEALAAHVSSGRVSGLVALIAHAGRTEVITCGRMAYQGEPMRPDAVFRIASLTKPVVGAASMSLVEEGALDLDQPVAQWLPELAAPRVLRDPTGPLSQTVPAVRPILVRHLLTMTFGLGAVLAPPGSYPVQRAMEEAGLEPGPIAPSLTPDQWMAALAEIPLAHQPGEGFLYHTGFEVLGVLLARASGRSLGQLLAERIFDPLNMHDTGFTVPPGDLERLPVAYRTGPDGSGVVAYDAPPWSHWAAPPLFESAGAGLVSTAADYYAFARMLLRDGDGVLRPESVQAMVTDELTAPQREAARLFLGLSSSWGLGVEVNQRRAFPWMTPGRFGWSGGTGTTAYIDPSFDLIGILLTQRLMDSPEPSGIATDFWRAVYECR